ncbi:Kelch repeat-containing protein [Spirosoma aerophilum]
MKVLFTCLFVVFLAGCQKGDDSSTSPQKTVNDIVLTANPINVPISSYDTGAFPIQSVLVGNSIYFGNYSNTSKAQFFVRYDLTANSFSSALAKSPNVCGCGYSSHLVSDGTNIFYIANDATKYTASTNTWTTLTYPATAKDNAGEAGVVYYNGNIYFVGGRTPSTLFKFYSISQDKWFTSPNYLYSTTSSEMAVYKDRIYVLGGQGAKQKMAYFSTTSNTWTAVKDVPVEVASNYGNVFSAVLGDNLYLLQGQSVYIYDLVNNTWATNPITLSGLPSNGNLFSNGQKLYISGKNASNIPVVTEVVVSTK